MKKISINKPVEVENAYMNGNSFYSELEALKGNLFQIIRCLYEGDKATVIHCSSDMYDKIVFLQELLLDKGDRYND